MYAIVKFKNNPTPELFGINNIGYAYRLSTMDEVEWVAGATISWNGTIVPTTVDKIQPSGVGYLQSLSIKPFLPGDPDPLARFRKEKPTTLPDD